MKHNCTSRKYEAFVRKSMAEILRNRGMANSEIASFLGVSYATVRNYIGPQPSRSFGGTYRTGGEFIPVVKSENGFSVKREKENKIVSLPVDNGEGALYDTLQKLSSALAELTSVLEGKSRAKGDGGGQKSKKARSSR